LSIIQKGKEIFRKFGQFLIAKLDFFSEVEFSSVKNSKEN
jgi:hypothetical protein